GCRFHLLVPDTSGRLKCIGRNARNPGTGRNRCSLPALKAQGLHLRRQAVRARALIAFRNCSYVAVYKAAWIEQAFRIELVLYRPHPRNAATSRTPYRLASEFFRIASGPDDNVPQATGDFRLEPADQCPRRVDRRKV